MNNTAIYTVTGTSNPRSREAEGNKIRETENASWLSELTSTSLKNHARTRRRAVIVDERSLSVAASDPASRAGRGNARGRVILGRARERRAGLVHERKREALRGRSTAHVDELAADAHREATVDARLVALCTTLVVNICQSRFVATKTYRCTTSQR